MSKNIKKSNNASINENILYLSENDANALGIFEDSIQRVYVDDHEVEVVFVDEHEIIPATIEERKVYNDAERLARKYANARMNNNGDDYDDVASPVVKNHWWQKIKKIGKRNQDNYANGYDEYESDYDQEISSSSNRALRPIKKGNYDDARSERSRLRQQILDERDALRSDNEKYARSYNNPNRKNNFTVRSDVFTEEELEVLQGMISKSKNSSSANQKKKVKNSKIKTINNKRK